MTHHYDDNESRDDPRYPQVAPIIGDASDKPLELSRAPRIQGWTVAQWIDWVKKNPDCTLPGGVGGAIVRYLNSL